MDKLPYEAQLYLLAVSSLQQGEYAKSLKLFNELIDKYTYNKPEYAEQESGFYYNRSIAKTQLDDIDGAIQDLKTSINIYELHQAYFELFKLYHFKGEPQSGMSFLIRAYELGSSEAEKVLRNNTNYFNR